MPTKMCNSSSVEPSQEIMVNEAKHAGLITHRCTLAEHTLETLCQCQCGQRWVRPWK